ncbi:unnamed protein product [Mytilus edulis]|uniref:B box-type domain-containing protein n=1 Tax=Mytilus edulis TaxID=6550 RepID=A0A8S3VKX8_MYTED|nr:unnamed protein product [Mytilus edulis]
MTSSEQHICTICHDEGIYNRAVTWCTECEVFFCGDCEKPHAKFKLSEKHKTMTSDDYQKLHTFLQAMNFQCREHKKKYELYCSFHASPCCVQCITDTHQICHELKPLSHILKQVKLSASVQLLEKDLKNVNGKLVRTITYLKTRISTNNIQKTKAVEKIRHMRKSIDDFLTKLEQQILDDLESKYSKLKSKLVNLVQQMENQTSKLNQMQIEFTKMTQYATEPKTYVIMKDVEKMTFRTLTIPNDLKVLNLSACVALPNSEVIILDFTKYQLLLFGNDGIFIRKVILFSAGPDDACFVRNNIVAVTLGPTNQTALVDVEKNQIIENIRLSHYCRGVASDGKVLIISCGMASTIVNLKDMSHTILYEVQTSRISIFQGHMVLFGLKAKLVATKVPENYSGHLCPMTLKIHEDLQ